jgi:hypothetical protein
LAENAGLAHRIEIIDFESLIVTNLLDRALAKGRAEQVTIRELIEAYSDLVEAHDPAAGIKVKLRSP